MHRTYTIALSGLLASGLGLGAWRSAAAPQAAVAGTSQAASSSLKFAYGGNAAQIAAKYIDRLVFFPVHVNQGKPSLFEVDSTAPISALSAEVAAEQGIATVANATLNLDGLDVTLPDLTQDSRKDFGAGVGRRFEGVLGKDFFDTVVVSLDYARQSAQVFDPASFHYTGKGKVLPIRFEGSLPVVQAKCDLDGKTFEADFVVNTALDVPVLISQSYANAHKVVPGRVRRLAATDLPLDSKATAVRVKTFELGPFTAQEAIAVITDLPLAKTGDSKLAGEIGAGMLRRYTATFDYSRKQLILEPNPTFPDDDPGDMSGLSIVATGPNLKRFEVVNVQPGTPGAEAKIQKGDVISGVDADPTADMTLADLRQIFRQVGHMYKLLLDRNGQEISVSIQMKRLL